MEIWRLGRLRRQKSKNVEQNGGEFKAIIADMGDSIPNSLLRVANTIFGGPGNKNQRLLGKMGKSKSIISDMDDTIRNSLLRAVYNISGCPEKQFWKFERNFETVPYRGRF